MHDEIAEVIALQEKLGLDVLVHGEPERNDMVQYFAEQLDGFTVTANGWVQSYGSRCVRPPILFGDVERPADMTVAWTTFAQSLTERPVKGMLTGPVTILAWSFVRDDEPIGEVARQVGLAIRDEVHALEAAGVAIVQVDEPALRELLPLRKADQAAYLDWAVASFRLATSGVADTTQIHTHLCYSEFGEVVDAIDGLDADVTSVEAARSHMEILGDLAASGYARGIGPGVYDIHSLGSRPPRRSATCSPRPSPPSPATGSGSTPTAGSRRERTTTSSPPSPTSSRPPRPPAPSSKEGTRMTLAPQVTDAGRDGSAGLSTAPTTGSLSANVTEPGSRMTPTASTGRSSVRPSGSPMACR